MVTWRARIVDWRRSFQSAKGRRLQSFAALRTCTRSISTRADWSPGAGSRAAAGWRRSCCSAGTRRGRNIWSWKSCTDSSRKGRADAWRSGSRNSSTSSRRAAARRASSSGACRASAGTSRSSCAGMQRRRTIRRNRRMRESRLAGKSAEEPAGCSPCSRLATRRPRRPPSGPHAGTQGGRVAPPRRSAGRMRPQHQSVVLRRIERWGQPPTRRTTLLPSEPLGGGSRRRSWRPAAGTPWSSLSRGCVPRPRWRSRGGQSHSCARSSPFGRLRSSWCLSSSPSTGCRSSRRAARPRRWRQACCKPVAGSWRATLLPARQRMHGSEQKWSGMRPPHLQLPRSACRPTRSRSSASYGPSLRRRRPSVDACLKPRAPTPRATSEPMRPRSARGSGPGPQRRALSPSVRR
mmetsp:Transcript_79240/g.246747  ORF Transcript_79240/g.246747 Transcript_79240/m.246747 type:complete len:406 (+) Transcript_79240:1048-2265(+)